jgi:very-short-patch-repair endonuclease
MSEALLAARALEQNGAFHRLDARAAGLSDKRIRSRVSKGEWIELLPSVYCNATTPRTHELMRHAALLWAGEGAVLSHRSAGALWVLDGITDDQPELTLPSDRRLRTTGVQIHRSDLAPSEITRRDAMPCTTLSRTIVDLASVVGPSTLEVAFESARRRYSLPVVAVHQQLSSMGACGRKGTAILREILDQLEGRPAAESPLEVKVAQLLRRAPIAEPERQYRIVIAGRTYRVDFAWPHWRVALECDGRAFHDFQRDRTRWRKLSAAGWRVLPVTWRDVHANWPDVVASLVDALSKGPDLPVGGTFGPML